MDIDTLILAGGLGTRLRRMVSDRPKPMAEVGGGPFMDLLLHHLHGFGLNRFILLTGYMSEYISDYYAAADFPFEIAVSPEDSPLGTAGAVKNAEPLLSSSSFLLLNGDSFCDVDIGRMIERHIHLEATVTMAVVKALPGGSYGSVRLDKDDRVMNFAEKADDAEEAYINAGVYVMHRKILKMITPSEKCSLELDIFPRLAGSDFFGFKTSGPLYDIGTPERLELARRVLTS